MALRDWSEVYEKVQCIYSGVVVSADSTHHRERGFIT
jgi:hypothetical protein